MLAWWRANDSAREWRFAAEATPASLDGFRRNLQRLADLLTDDTDDDRLMRAEVLRELGEFDAAEQALQAVSGECGWVADQIRSLCAAKDTRVHKLVRGRTTRA